jgi:hypothetical protein
MPRSGLRAQGSGLRVQGRCYWCLKVAALNGHRDRLEFEALEFVGFVSEPERDAGTREPAWLPAAARHERMDAQLEELARLRDVAPGWIALARQLMKDDGDKA